MAVPGTNLAEELVHTLERRQRRWSWQRWLCVAIGAFFLAALVWTALFVRELETVVSWDEPPDYRTASPAQMKAYVTVQMVRSRMLVVAFSTVVVAAAGLGAMLGLSAGRWNRRVTDGLLAQLLRADLQRIAPPPPSDAEPRRPEAPLSPPSPCPPDPHDPPAPDVSS
jgi:hypothetical protein